jgi:Ca2+-binding EF-hand superfamily protein
VSIIIDMKYLLSIIALTLSLSAQGKPENPPGQGENRRKPPEISKEFREEMLKKYDTNKDGKLDREERSKISLEDRKKVGPPRRGPKAPPPPRKN